MAPRSKMTTTNSITKTNSMRRTNETRWKKFNQFLAICLGILICAFHSVYINALFENSKHFSHLSTMEREMSFRTEMGFYYSFFKRMTDSVSAMEGLNSLMKDNLTEYPNEINALHRFNVYQELLLGVAFRNYVDLMKYFNIPVKDCWLINRGDDLKPVESCDGLGDPSYFYIKSIWLLNGISASVLFFYSYFLSNSILGGILAVLCFFFNHGECTRVQWSPPLRENFGYPVFLAQMFAVSVLLRNQKTNRCNKLICFLTALFIIFWQFAPFALTTQLMAIFLLYVLRFVSSDIAVKYLTQISYGLGISFVFLFFNQMLVTSVLTAAIIAAFIVIMLKNRIEQIKLKLSIESQFLISCLEGGLFLMLIILLKKIFSFGSQDAHIWNLLRAKFLNKFDFHSSLYVCAVEFGFLEKESVWKLTETFLLPTTVIVTIIVVGQIFHREYTRNKLLIKKHFKPDANKEDSEILYNILQLCAFAIMAALIMRLKLFFTPHLCITSSLLCSTKFFNVCQRKWLHSSFIVVVVALMSVQGIQNVQSELKIIGEYSNPSMEELFEWVKTHTSSKASFAGPMPIMANLMLSTGRPIINHPHYEDSRLRERTKTVYTLFSRKPIQEVHENLKSLRADYAVVDEQWCYRGSRKGCSLLEVWNREDEKNSQRISVCDQLQLDPTPFTMVFRNEFFAVIAI